MHLNDKIYQLRKYFSGDRSNKVKKFFHSPYFPIVATGIVCIVWAFVIQPHYVRSEFDRQIGAPLRQLQQEYFRGEDARMQRQWELMKKAMPDMFKDLYPNGRTEDECYKRK